MSRASILIIRRRESYDYLRDPAAAPSWGNNDKNNMLDAYLLFINGIETVRCQVQTVANHPEARYENTIAPGQFGIRLLVETRLFSGRIHGIVGARDLEGDWVDYASIQLPYLARWLEHDTRKLKKEPSDPDMTETTRVAWSAGCIIHKPADLENATDVLLRCGYKAGDVVPTELVVV